MGKSVHGSLHSVLYHSIPQTSPFQLLELLELLTAATYMPLPVTAFPKKLTRVWVGIGKNGFAGWGLEILERES